MRLKISRIILASSIIIMICLSISMSINNKSEIKIEEIKGDKSALEDVSIICQDIESMYKTSKTTITKDGISKNNFAQTISTRFSDAQDLITNEDMLNYSQGIVGTYQYDNYVGVVSVGTHYTNETSNDEKLQIVATVMEENIETGKLAEYTIPLGAYFKNNGDNGISTNTVPIRYEENLYIVVGVDIENYNNINAYENQIEESRIYVYGDNGISTNTVPIRYEENLYIVVGVDIENYNNINAYENQIEESRIYVYKLDLENESSENILTKSLSKDGESAIGYNAAFAKDDTAYFVNTLYSKNDKYEVNESSENILTKSLSKDGESAIGYNAAFAKDDTAYFVNTLYSKNDKYEVKRETQLLSFSLKTRKFETIELGKDGESNEEEELDGLWNIFKYYLIDDKAYFIYDYIGGEKFEIREMEVDLNTKKIVNKEIAYSLEFDDSIKNDDKAYFIYDYIGGEKFEIREMEVDLNTKKIVNKEIAYSLEFDDSIKNTNSMSYTIENIRCIDNKLFISIETQKDTEASWDSRPITTSYLYIVDRNSKETVYAAKINEGKNKNIYTGGIDISVVK